MIALRHPIRAKVNDRYRFLVHLLQEYPNLIGDWEEKTAQEFKTLAKKEANGDCEVENDIFLHNIRAFDDIDFRKDLFYKSMLIMAYSYFEGCKEIIKSETDEIIDSDKIASIYHKKQLAMPDKLSKALAFMNKIRELRNNIAHNNCGTFKSIESLKELSKDWDGVDFEYNKDIYHNELIISKPDIIMETLNQAYYILSDICEKLNYKTTLI